jgi:DNA (cytosine-5)-methyltransferase 1
MPTAQPFLRNDKPMDVSRFSRFGLTSLLLTADRGEALLTWYRAGFRVRTSAPQDQATALTELEADSGASLRGSFAKYDHDTRTWRTHQFSLLGDYTEFSETWPSWGWMRDGVCWELPMSERPILETESGLLPTPVTVDTGSMFNQSASSGAALRPTLGAMARFNLWPTPTCGGGGQTLPEGTTPQGITPDGRKQTVCLERAVMNVERQLWPTPTVCGNYNRKGASKSSGDGLATAVRNFPTPRASDGRKGIRTPEGAARERERKGGGIDLPSAVNGRLNPDWVEWLMGWPIGWTALQPLEMDRFREWQQQHGGCSMSSFALQGAEK